MSKHRQSTVLWAIGWAFAAFMACSFGQTRGADTASAAWYAKDLSAGYRKEIEGGIGARSRKAPEPGSKIIEIIGTFGNVDSARLTLDATNVFIELVRDESGIRKVRKWDLLGVGVVGNKGNADYIFLKELVQGAVTKSLATDDGCRVAKKDASSPLTLTLTKNPSRLCLAFLLTEDLSGEKLKLHFGDAAVPVEITSPQKERSSKRRDSALLPAFQHELQGNNPVRIRNPNDFAVVAGIRSKKSGKNLDVPANGIKTVYIPDGTFDIYFVYSDKPGALFQGDSFTLNNSGVEIQIVKVVNGNYGIRQVK